MEKCWLIRTRNKQILGPVTKQKIIEFIDKGSLAPEDEVTSGNGYWISIKENNLIEKYVKGDIPQGFNPISEAPNILTVKQEVTKENTGSLNPNTMPKSEDEELPSIKIEFDKEDAIPVDDDLDYPDMSSPSPTEGPVTPCNDDLEYPDMGIVEESPVAVSTPAPVTPTPVKLNVHVAEQEACNNEEGKLPESDDLEYPDMDELISSPAVEEFDPDATDPNFDLSSADITQDDIVFSEPPQVLEEETPDLPESIKKKVRPSVERASTPPIKKKKKVKKKAKPQRNDRYLFYILILLIGLIASGAYYYFTNIINSDVVNFNNPFIHSVHAQTPYSGDVKKKTFLKLLHS